MLYADKRALETNLQVSLLKIREKELQFYTQNCIAIGTQAALLSGFAYNGIIQVDIPSDASDWLKTCYLCVTTMAMGFELIAVLNSTLCSMLGPGLALRGPDGSMHRAVDGLMLEYRLTFLFFVMGLLAFHVSALLFAWLEFSWPVALAMTVALVTFVYGMWRYFKRIYKRFSLDREHMITGERERRPPPSLGVCAAAITSPSLRRESLPRPVHSSPPILTPCPVPWYAQASSNSAMVRQARPPPPSGATRVRWATSARCSLGGSPPCLRRMRQASGSARRRRSAS